ncbi:MAG: metal-dependent hydrolase [Anaerolineae bacterium]|nr:metal-dependent hydrolase [Anaerolineae bacterium]
MIFPGHVAAAFLVSEALGVDRRGALAASMFPDTVDKPVRWLLGLTPNDRIPAHTALGLLLSTFVVSRFGDQRFTQGWMAGYIAHLFCDEINAHLNPGRIYLWWPFRRYRLHTGPTGLQSSLNDFSRLSMLVEGAMTALALAAWARRRRRAADRTGT